AAEYFCRLLEHMKSRGYSTVVAVPQEGDRSEQSVMGGALTSGYIQRGDAVMPRQGTRGPWEVINNYFRDRKLLRKGAIEDGVPAFGRPPAATPPTAGSRSARTPSGISARPISGPRGPCRQSWSGATRQGLGRPDSAR